MWSSLLGVFLFICVALRARPQAHGRWWLWAWGGVHLGLQRVQTEWHLPSASGSACPCIMRTSARWALLPLLLPPPCLRPTLRPAPPWTSPGPKDFPLHFSLRTALRPGYLSAQLLWSCHLLPRSVPQMSWWLRSLLSVSVQRQEAESARSREGRACSPLFNKLVMLKAFYSLSPAEVLRWQEDHDQGTSNCFPCSAIVLAWGTWWIHRCAAGELRCRL